MEKLNRELSKCSLLVSFKGKGLNDGIIVNINIGSFKTDIPENVALELLQKYGNIDEINHTCDKVESYELSDRIHEPQAMSKEGFIYLIESQGFYKIGRTKSKNRITKYVTENPNEIKLHVFKFVDNCEEKEKMLHELFALKRFRGEWFELDESDIKALENCLK